MASAERVGTETRAAEACELASLSRKISGQRGLAEVAVELAAGQVGQVAAPEFDLVGGKVVKAEKGAVVGGAGRGGDEARQVLAAETADEAEGGLHRPDLASEAGHRAGSDAVA